MSALRPVAQVVEANLKDAFADSEPLPDGQQPRQCARTVHTLQSLCPRASHPTPCALPPRRTIAHTDAGSAALLDVARTQQLARLEAKCRRLDTFDKVLIMLTAAYPIKQLRLAKLRNDELEAARAGKLPVGRPDDMETLARPGGVVGNTDDGGPEDEPGVDETHARRKPLQEQRKKDMRSDVVTFVASEALPYVARLTTRVQRRHLRAMEGRPPPRQETEPPRRRRDPSAGAAACTSAARPPRGAAQITST